MRLEINMHVHTFRSACAKAEMTLQAIQKRAEESGIRFIGLSDHVDLPGDVWRPLGTLEEVSSGKWDINFLAGCEATVISPRKMALDAQTAERLDFVMVSANHYHLSHVENPAVRTPEEYAKHYMSMLWGVTRWGRAAIVAHPFLHGKLGKILDPYEVIQAYDLDEVERWIAESAGNGISLEMRPGYAGKAAPFFREIVKMCRHHGMKLSLGTDAHRLREVSYPDSFIDKIRQLDIRISDIIDPGDLLDR